MNVPHVRRRQVRSSLHFGGEVAIEVHVHEPTEQEIKEERVLVLINESKQFTELVRSHEWIYVGAGSFTTVSMWTMPDGRVVIIRKVDLWNGSKRGLDPNRVQGATSFAAFVKEICVCLDNPNTPNIYGAWVEGGIRGGSGYMAVEFCRDVDGRDFHRPIAAFMSMFGGDMHTMDNIGIGEDGRIVMRDTGQQPSAESFIDGENDHPVVQIVGAKEDEGRVVEWRAKGFRTPLRSTTRVTNMGYNTC